jgi:hypothetical protein
MYVGHKFLRQHVGYFQQLGYPGFGDLETMAGVSEGSLSVLAQERFDLKGFVMRP